MKEPQMYRCEAFNPFATATLEWIDGFLRMICADGLKSAQRSELDDQIEALVPALIELRDAGHIQLNAAALASFGTLEGFSKLASDGRLSELSRRRCEAIRVRLVVQGVKALLGHN